MEPAELGVEELLGQTARTLHDARDPPRLPSHRDLPLAGQRPVPVALGRVAVLGRRGSSASGGGDRPLGDEVRPGRDRKRGQSARIVQQWRADAGHDLVQRHPLHVRRGCGIPHAARQPNFQQRAGRDRRRGAEQADLAVAAPEILAQHVAASFLPAPPPHGHEQRPVMQVQRQRSVMQRDHGDLAVALHRPRQLRALEIAEQPLGPVELPDEQRAQAEALLERLRQGVQAGPTGAEAADFELLEAAGQLLAAHRHDVAHQLELGAREPAAPSAPDAPLGLELDAGDEPGRLDERPKAPRRVRTAGERFRAFELRHFRLERLRDHEGDRAVRPPQGLHPQEAAIVDLDPEAAHHPAAAQTPIGRVEVRVAMERLLHGAGNAQPQRRGVPHQPVEDIQGRDLGSPLRDERHR